MVKRRGVILISESCKYGFYSLVHNTTARGGAATQQTTIITHHTDLELSID